MRFNFLYCVYDLTVNEVDSFFENGETERKYTSSVKPASVVSLLQFNGKFHRWGENLCKSQIPLRNLVRSWSATSFEPASNQIA